MDPPRHCTSAPNVVGAGVVGYASEAQEDMGWRRSVTDPIQRPIKDRRWVHPAGKMVTSKYESVEEEQHLAGLCHYLSLTFGSVGVVFGDIGTSPLYVYTGVFVTELHAERPEPEDIVATFSMIFWLLTWVVCIKYVSVLMRVSHHGEGGTFALMQRILSAESEDAEDEEEEVSGEESEEGSSEDATRSKAGGGSKNSKLTAAVSFMAVLGCSLLAGDGCITPVMSVLSAIEGIPVEIGQTWHVVIATVILLLLFSVQRAGSHLIGCVSGPVMVCWFLAIASLGIYNLVKYSEAGKQVIFTGFNPVSIYRFWVEGRYSGYMAWRSLAGVVLAVTGSEALYADMGHFGARPITAAWFFLVYPCLVLQYMGQAAAQCVEPSENPFWTAVPDVIRWPMVILATLATVIASQALITGLFSLLTQAYALKFLPRILVLNTNPDEHGQVYIPEINWALCVACIVLCLAFRNSGAIGGAYGVAVTSTFLVSTLLLWVVLIRVRHWNWFVSALLILPMLVIDLLLWSANMMKIADSGWVPVVISMVICLLMTTHAWGRAREEACLEEQKSHEVKDLRENGTVTSLSAISTIQTLKAVLSSTRLVRTDKVAVFMTPLEGRVPSTIGTLASLIGCLPRTIVLLSVRFMEVPFISEKTRARFIPHGSDIFSVVLHFGYAEPISAQRLAIQKALFRVALEHSLQYPQLRPLLELGRDRPLDQMNMASSSSSALAVPTDMHVLSGTTAEASGDARRPTFVLHRVHYAVAEGATPDCWTLLRIKLYSFLVLNARKPITFFGLEGYDTMEISVVRFL